MSWICRHGKYNGDDEACGLCVGENRREANRAVNRVAQLEAAIQYELDGCFCEDADGNSNPPHKPSCARCLRLQSALKGRNIP